MNHVTAFEIIQDELHQVDMLMSAQAGAHHADLQAALSHLIRSGGKRVRPVVTILTGKILCADPKATITLSAAIELLHTATLVHDDLIDGSLLRRGIPTLNSHWSPGATVLTGDFIFAKAAKLAAETGSVAVMQLFAETLAIIVNGEIVQMFDSKGLANRENYYERIYAKTASMFELATGAAALLSPADDQTQQTARRFGYELGMAFQIVDDVLDFIGEQNTVGKPIGSDLRQGLITLPALYYLEHNPNDPDMRVVLNRQWNQAQIERLVAAVRASGAVQHALDEAAQFVARAQSLLRALPESSARQPLLDLTDYFLARTR